MNLTDKEKLEVMPSLIRAGENLRSAVFRYRQMTCRREKLRTKGKDFSEKEQKEFNRCEHEMIYASSEWRTIMDTLGAIERARRSP